MLFVLKDQIYFEGAFGNKHEEVIVEENYKQCFFEYYEKLYGYAFNIVQDNAEAKDIVQNAFLKLWQKREDVNLQNAAGSYLYTTVYHLALNTIRNKKTRDKHRELIEINEHSNKIYTLEQKEVRNRIQQAIDTLPPRCKEVFYKSRFEGKKYAEIARDLNLSVKTVEAQIGKALKSLREQLSDLVLAFLIYLFF